MPGEHWAVRNAHLHDQILTIVEQHWSLHDRGPGRDYLARVLGVSRATAHNQVTALIEEGQLLQDAGKPNTLRLSV